MSYSQMHTEIGLDASLYLAFVTSVDPLAKDVPAQTSKLRARLVPEGRKISIDIRIHANVADMPTILVSNVVNHDCFIRSNTPLYLSDPRIIDENDFKLSIEPTDYATVTANGEIKKFLIAHIHKVGDVNKDSLRDVQVICRSTLAPQRDTFSDRKLAVWTMSDGIFGIGENLRYVKRQRYSIDFSGFSEHDAFRVFGGNPVVADAEIDPAASRILPGKNWPEQATVYWRVTKMALLRDVALVVSGSMLGFAGAFFVEWLRSKTEKTV